MRLDALDGVMCSSRPPKAKKIGATTSVGEIEHGRAAVQPMRRLRDLAAVERYGARRGRAWSPRGTRANRRSRSPTSRCAAPRTLRLQEAHGGRETSARRFVEGRRRPRPPGRARSLPRRTARRDPDACGRRSSARRPRSRAIRRPGPRSAGSRVLTPKISCRITTPGTPESLAGAPRMRASPRRRRRSSIILTSS